MEKEVIDLTIIIISFNTKELLSNCVESVFEKTRNINYEVIVVDNASKDGSVKALDKRIKSPVCIKIIKNKLNVGFASANNQGLRKAQGRYILLLNSDTILKDNVLGEFTHWMDQNLEVGIATCALKNQNGSFQGSGGFFPTLARVFSWMTIQDIPGVDWVIKPFHPLHSKSFGLGSNFYERQREMDWITGAFFFMRRDVLKQVGLLDENYFMYVEELDYCFRAKKKGWKVYYLPQWEIIHLGGASSTSEFALLSEYKGIKLFYKKYYPAWQFPVLRLLLKFGALGRIILFGILEGPSSAKIYAKAFLSA